MSPVWKRPSREGEEREPRPRWPARPAAGGVATPPQGGDLRSGGASPSRDPPGQTGTGKQGPGQLEPGAQEDSPCWRVLQGWPPRTGAHAARGRPRGGLRRGRRSNTGAVWGRRRRLPPRGCADSPTTQLPATRCVNRKHHSQVGTARGQVTVSARWRQARETDPVLRNQRGNQRDVPRLWQLREAPCPAPPGGRDTRPPVTAAPRSCLCCLLGVEPPAAAGPPPARGQAGAGAEPLRRTGPAAGSATRATRSNETRL